jgi:hypothetical protein
MEYRVPVHRLFVVGIFFLSHSDCWLHLEACVRPKAPHMDKTNLAWILFTSTCRFYGVSLPVYCAHVLPLYTQVVREDPFAPLFELCMY